MPPEARRGHPKSPFRVHRPVGPTPPKWWGWGSDERCSELRGLWCVLHPCLGFLTGLILRVALRPPIFLSPKTGAS
eukprot:1203198-Pyramimonas_sp.AAC.1